MRYSTGRMSSILTLTWSVLLNWQTNSSLIQSKVKALSTGYASIFKAIVALCSNTKYILLDEPVWDLMQTTGLLYKVILDRYANNQKQ